MLLRSHFAGATWYCSFRDCFDINEKFHRLPTKLYFSWWHFISLRAGWGSRFPLYYMFYLEAFLCFLIYRRYQFYALSYFLFRLSASRHAAQTQFSRCVMGQSLSLRHLPLRLSIHYTGIKGCRYYYRRCHFMSVARFRRKVPLLQFLFASAFRGVKSYQ